jgi:hypothetical protein
MRYWICDISNPASESRFEIDFDEPPAEGSVIAPGRLVYKVKAIVRLASETSPGIIEVHRVAESPRIRGSSAERLLHGDKRPSADVRFPTLGVSVEPAPFDGGRRHLRELDEHDLV